jgi:hypothetical protein
VTHEKRRFVRWQTVWTMPLSNIERAHVANEELVIDTKHDGMRVVPLGRTDDPAIAELDAFLAAR